MKVTKSQQDKIRDWDLIRLAEERLARCMTAGDVHGIAYNERRIARYRAMLKATPVPEPKPIPGAVP